MKRGAERLAPVALVLLFLACASAYLHFFVDDEAITLRFARNLLDGHGFSYNSGDGPVEGFSNFLHVIVMSGLLGLTRLAGLADIWAIAIGNAFSLACGAAVVLLAWRLVKSKEEPTTKLARVSSVACLAMAGPFSVWAVSSLETALFSLAFIGLIAVSWRRVTPYATVTTAVVAILVRTDGFLWAGAWLAARFLTGDRETKRTVLLRVAPWVAGALGAFSAWRFWYFGSLLSLPLQTKVMHKFASTDAVSISRQEIGYLMRFAEALGWPLVIATLILAAFGLAPSATRRAAAALWIALSVLMVYVGTVGDWMFGFRFAVPLLAPFVALMALGLGWLTLRSRWIGHGVAVAMVALSAVQASAFRDYFKAEEKRPLFWEAPTISSELKFGRWLEPLAAAREVVRPGMRIAFHDAGLVPFLLDAPNIDPLGLVDAFVGRLPTLDPVFTDVGRYYPVTETSPIEAVHAYLLWRNVDVLIMRKSWMQTANHGRVPALVLGGGYFALARETGQFTIYTRTSQPVVADLRQRRGFLENLLHPAYAADVLLDGTAITPARLLSALPPLSAMPTFATLGRASKWSLVSKLREAMTAFAFHLEGGMVTQPLRVSLTLRDGNGAITGLVVRDVGAGEHLSVHDIFPTGRRTAQVELSLASLDGGPLLLNVHTIRLLGQGEALVAHLRKFSVGVN